MEVLQELLVCDVGRQDDEEDCLALDPAKHLFLALDDSVAQLLVCNQLSQCIYRFAKSLFIKVDLFTGSIVIALGSAAIKPVEADACFIEAHRVVAKPTACPSLDRDWVLPMRPGHNDRVPDIDFHAFDPR